MVMPAKPGDDIPELDMIVAGPNSAPPHAVYLQQAFAAAGFNCPAHSLTDQPKVPDGSLTLRVLLQKSTGNTGR